MSRYGTPLWRVLELLARAESLVPDDDERETLAMASDVLKRIERQPEVVIVAGNGVDPVVQEVEQIAEDWRDVRDTLAVIEDRCRDLARLLREPKERTA